MTAPNWDDIVSTSTPNVAKGHLTIRMFQLNVTGVRSMGLMGKKFMMNTL